MNKIDFKKIRSTKEVDIDGQKITLRALSVGEVQTLGKSEGEFKGLEQLAAAIIDPETGETAYTVDELKEMQPSVCTLLIENLNELHGGGAQAEVAKN